MFLEVDVEPMALRGTGFASRGCDQRGTRAFRPAVPGDHGVQEEGVNPAVPGDVDETDQ